jgi:undecaprenyl-diphosphatase
MEFLEAWDLGAAYGMAVLHKQEAWLTPVMHFITALGNTQVLGLVSFLSALFFIFIDRWRVACCLVAAALISYGVSTGTKQWVNRPRPEMEWVLKADKPNNGSFPSGHALVSMAVYGTFALSLAAEIEGRKMKTFVTALGLSLPLLIGFSRLYLGVHYMSDVLGGLCAGLGCVLVFRWIELKWSAASQPRVAAAIVSIPAPPAEAPRALEQVQPSSGEQISS